MKLTVISLKATSLFSKNYCYLIFDSLSQEAVVIDPVGEMRLFDEIIAINNLRLNAALITHTHPDHVQLAESMMRKYGCQIVVSIREDLGCFSSIRNKLSLNTTETPMRMGELLITPIHTPGHTMGSICYLIGDNLFTGDTLFIEGCGMCFGEKSDPKLLFSSLNKLKNIIPSDTKIFPGHSFGHEPGKQFHCLLMNNIYLNINEEDKFVSFRMRSGQKGLFDFH